MLLHLSPDSLLFALKLFLDNPFGKDWDQKSGLVFSAILKISVSQSILLIPFLGSGGSVIPFGFKITQLPSFLGMKFIGV